ncbi:hypothetical protein ACFSCX_05875 [Bacillus salitolerans]|uniref:Uncharacterized protein n=1 Tax=Bacillus salitolerans TaxID=1437434 RepID=A0ABW4LMU9_9BACI
MKTNRTVLEIQKLKEVNAYYEITDSIGEVHNLLYRGEIFDEATYSCTYIFWEDGDRYKIVEMHEHEIKKVTKIEGEKHRESNYARI